MSTFSAWWWVLTIVAWNHQINHQLLLGIYREYHGNIMGISWEYHGNIYCLVVLSILKNICVRQWEGWHPIYEMDNNKKMFETTNQFWWYFPHVRQIHQFLLPTSIGSIEILILASESSNMIQDMMDTLWLWLTVRHGIKPWPIEIDGKHRFKKWLDFPWLC